jgi:hypothetical protein
MFPFLDPHGPQPNILSSCICGRELFPPPYIFFTSKKFDKYKSNFFNVNFTQICTKKIRFTFTKLFLPSKEVKKIHKGWNEKSSYLWARACCKTNYGLETFFHILFS